MRRKIFNLAAVVSLIVCLGFAAIGVRSLDRKDTIEYFSQDGRLVMLISKSGRLNVLYISRWKGDEPGLSHRTESAPFALGGTDYTRRFLGFGVGVSTNGGRFVNIPY